MIRATPNNLRQTLFFFGASEERRRRGGVGDYLKIKREHRHKRGTKNGKGAVGNSVSLLSHSTHLHSGLVPSRLLLI